MTVITQNSYTYYLKKDQNPSSSAVSFTKRDKSLNFQPINFNHVNQKGDFFNSKRNNNHVISQGDTFQAQKAETPIQNLNKTVPYTNKFSKNLKAKPNPQIKALFVADPSITKDNLEKAIIRTQSFSRYLKEEMVGFITPGGQEWFKGACTYLIKGTAGVDLSEEFYEKFAKQLWEHLAKADKYWISDEFIDYLQTLGPDNDAGVKATINAIKQIKTIYNTRSSNISFGYESEMRFIKKLLEDGCAYTGLPMKIEHNSSVYPTLEHIFPHSIKGDVVNDDCNYVLATADSNGLRQNIPLIDFLKGWDGEDYNKEFPRWKNNRKSEVKKKPSPEQFERYNNKKLRAEYKFKKHQVRLLNKSRNNHSTDYKNLVQRVEELRVHFENLKAAQSNQKK